jgi:hypothetical protein
MEGSWKKLESGRPIVFMFHGANGLPDSYKSIETSEEAKQWETDLREKCGYSGPIPTTLGDNTSCHGGGPVLRDDCGFLR